MITAAANAPDTLSPRELRDCSTSGNVTRSLLGYLALAGPFYVVVSLAQALTRQGFDLAHDEWSLLALGHAGWIQTTNLILTGAMTLAGAFGVRRAVRRSAGAGTGAAWLLGGYGLALIGAGIFQADAAHGFPPAADAGGAAQHTAHGMLHLAFGSIGFLCLISTCLVIARFYARERQRDAVASRVMAIVLAVAFAGIATGVESAAINLAFTAAVVGSCAWLTAVAVDFYRRTRLEEASR